MLRGQVTLHFRIFFFEDSVGRVKILLLRIFCGVFFYLSEVLSKFNWNGGMPTLDECFSVVTWQKKSLRFYWPRDLDTPFSYFRVHPVTRITHSTHYFFNISVNTFSCSWPEDKYGNWIPKWVTWPLLWQLSIRLNLYNMLKLLPKFPINMLHIYRDRPPPLFFRVVYVP